MPTDVEDIDIEDVEEALLRADELATITGRKKTDIVADLLDDGKLNLSAGSDAEVKKDILDIAQEKAEKFKTLITTLIPVLALLLGVGAEGLGVLDITGWGSDSMWEDDDPHKPPNAIYWGCTDYNADNYDPMATQDDGSCYFEPPCDSNWEWENVVIRSADINGEGFNNDLEIKVEFRDVNWCDDIMDNGHFSLIIEKEGQIWEQWQINDNFRDEYFISETRMNLQPGDYRVVVAYQRDGGNWLGPSALVTMESPQGCDASLINAQSYILEADAEKDAVRISADVDLTDGEDNCDSEQFQITWRLYQDNQVKYEHQTYEDGEVTDPDGADYTFHTWDNVDAGTYDSKVLLMLNGELLDEQWTGNTVTVQSPKVWGCIDSEATNYNADATDDDGSCEYPDTTPCDADIDNLQVTVSENEVTVIFYIAQHEETDCSDWDIEINLMPVDDNEEDEINHEHSISPSSNYYSHTFEDVPNGDWAAEVILSQNENCASDCEIADETSSWVYVNYEEICEINVFWIAIATNATHAQMGYDLDCGYEDNDLDGYNVSVQFLVYEVGSNTSNGSEQPQPIVWDTRLHYIQGWVEDNHIITLTNFTESNNTHYDFYGYFVWVDGEGESQTLEYKWLNREIDA